MAIILREVGCVDGSVNFSPIASKIEGNVCSERPIRALNSSNPADTSPYF